MTWDPKLAQVKRAKFDECVSARASAIAHSEPTKAELRQMLAEAAANTAKLQGKGTEE